MSESVDYDDLPIDQAEQDLFGLAPFVAALAKSIKTMRTPTGVVIGINGPWGSGKSSAINLLKRNLADVEDLQIVSFNPWWFRGEEALVLAFFRELYAATKPGLTTKAKKLVPKLGARLLKAGEMVTPAADLLGASGAGALAAGTMGWLSGLITDGESVEKLHGELAAALTKRGKRYVVLIDDIDRLSPDEALAMFRLVKSVGRLPNVIYVLAFDRTLAERVVAERYPSEGPHYLEKIVQASFELPAPDAARLSSVLSQGIFAITGQPDDRRAVHVMNLFYDVVAREVRTPRDIVRYLNALSITWPAVADDVDLGDFLALEAYRLFQPSIYAAIRSNKATVTGAADRGNRNSDAAKAALDELLLGAVRDKERYKSGLMRIFPMLESIWSNVFHSGDQRWARDRRACSADHFQTYFGLAPGDGVMRAAEVTALLSLTSDRSALENRLRKAGGEIGTDGISRAALLLDTLNVHGADINLADAVPTLSAVFAAADDLPSDRSPGFLTAYNGLRVHWLLRSILFDRTSLAERSAILLQAVEHSGLGWLANLQRSAWGDYHPREGDQPQSEEKCLLLEKDVDLLRAQLLARIEAAAADDTLLDRSDVGTLLFVWSELKADDGDAAKAWTAKHMGSDHAVAVFAKAFTGESWSQGLGFAGGGDLVAKRTDRASIADIETIMDRDEFLRRVDEVVSREPSGADDDIATRRFHAALNRGRDRDD